MHVDGLQTIRTHGSESNHMVVSVVVLTPEFVALGSRTDCALGRAGLVGFVRARAVRSADCDVLDATAVICSRTGCALG